LLFGYLKNADKNEFIVQKAVELGVKHIVVFSSEYSSAYMNENKLERLNKVAKEAAKQCLRATAPTIIYADTLKKALSEAAGYENKLFACEFATESKADVATLKGSTAIVIGSEGGFSDAEIEQLYVYVVSSPFLRENLQYVDRMKSVDFLYVSTNDTVNAFAGRRVVENDGKKQLAFHTVVFGGAARYARLVGLAAAMEDNGYNGMLKKFVEAMPKSFCGSCSEIECVKFIQDNGLDKALGDEAIRQKAISFSSGTIVSVLAHETGHHALGHLLSVAEKCNLEISRNQEREADSFASSIISTSPFGEYIFAGTLFWHYAIASQADAASDTTSDHPLSKERFENFVRANAEKASAMGISVN
jgi:hypothetical protein